jgi:hypothetical protein
MDITCTTEKHTMDEDNSVEVDFDPFFSAKPLKRNLNSYYTP